MAKTKIMDFDRALELFEPVIGLEVHVELNTETKMFSSAQNVFGSEPNTNVTPVCLGLPGTLPVVNGKAVRYSITLGLALGCDIAELSGFSRKNYFYPDLAKNYQISQADDPIATDGSVEIELASGRIIHVPIERAHMEEDAGKLTHIGGSTGRIQGAEYSLVDYNRAGVPLVEIVTRPIFGGEADTPEIASTYVSTIRDIVIVEIWLYHNERWASLLRDLKRHRGTHSVLSGRVAGACNYGTVSLRRNDNRLIE